MEDIWKQRNNSKHENVEIVTSKEDEETFKVEKAAY